MDAPEPLLIPVVLELMTIWIRDSEVKNKDRNRQEEREGQKIRKTKYVCCMIVLRLLLIKEVARKRMMIKEYKEGTWSSALGKARRKSDRNQIQST